ncbi:hypothetical protein KC19_9G049500 [Ceratodon purpureus]|uniref:Uncharacterized protein n=1 Tax=Ceratodon purpureus TaxID=3225 RepID=A0A8T0GQG5_CERPU|nr:hypothetical protein KC19_9G049500 [Ceratodon purpureus]
MDLLFWGRTTLDAQLKVWQRSMCSELPRGTKKLECENTSRLDQLCSIASVTQPTYIAESPWFVRRKSVWQPTSQRGSKYDHLHAPPVKQPTREMRIDEELGLNWEQEGWKSGGKSLHNRELPVLEKGNDGPKQLQRSHPAPYPANYFSWRPRPEVQVAIYEVCHL